ncbi:hypothetical protein OH491_16690 [Termitidicoccus mucosus]|uniref:Uncharacterized protein n=1 Tax=Termitidicoccus mucosus TaxID=1184151 RepID=A0A178IKS2_9BACT|nr:hypothetical protein AW736_11890 [Opitutaceae bacterium TSB47]
MPLKQQIAAKQAKEKPTLRRNPEVDAKIDEFIRTNPKIHEYYMGLTKEELVRKAILAKVQRSEYSNQRNEAIAAWVEEHPDLKAKIEERIKSVPAERRQRAFITMARTEAVKETLKASQGQGIRA